MDLPEVQGTQESSPTPQFKSINSLALSLLYGPTLPSVHDHWKNHSFALRTYAVYFVICHNVLLASCFLSITINSPLAQHLNSERGGDLSPRTAVTKYHKLSGFKQQKCVVSQSRRRWPERLESRSHRATLSLSLSRNPCLLLSWPLMLWAVLSL